jgi:hypothetical protein
LNLLGKKEKENSRELQASHALASRTTLKR